MMKRYILLIFAAAILAACSGDRRGMPLVEQEMTLSGLSQERWTYFSVEKGAVVGSSTFCSGEEDALWRERTDWDFAVCGKYLKTNGGTSGEGHAAVLRDETSNFLSLETAPEEGYLQDEVQVVR